MPLTIGMEDIKLQVLLNIDYARHATGPMQRVAWRLAQLFATQLPTDVRRMIENNEKIDLTPALEGF